MQIPGLKMSGFRKDILVTLFFRGITLACSLATSIITARYLLPEGRGVLATLTGTNLMAVQVVNLGLVGSTAYFVATQREHISTLLALAILHSVLFGLASVFIGVGLLYYSPEIFDGVSPLLLVISMISVPCMIFVEHARRVYLGLKKIFQFNHIESSLRILMLLVTVVMLILLGRGLTDYVYGLSGLYLLLSVFFALTLVRSHGVSLAVDRALWRGIWGFGLKSYVTNVFTLLVMQVDVYLINYFLGSTDNGYYSVVVQLANLVLTAPTMVGMVVFSWVANQEATDKLVLKAVIFTALITLFPLIVLAFWGGSVIAILFGREYLAAVAPLKLMLPGILLLSVQLIFAQVLVGKGLPVFLPVTWFVALVLKVALEFYLIPLQGISGAALSTTAAYLLVSAVVLIHFAVNYGKPKPAGKPASEAVLE